MGRNGSKFWWLPWFPAVFYPRQTFLSEWKTKRKVMICICQDKQELIVPNNHFNDLIKSSASALYALSLSLSVGLKGPQRMFGFCYTRSSQMMMMTVLTSGSARTNMSSDSHQTVIVQSSGSHRAVIMQSLGSHRIVVWQSLDSCRTVIGTVIRQTNDDDCTYFW